MDKSGLKAYNTDAQKTYMVLTSITRTFPYISSLNPESDSRSIEDLIAHSLDAYDDLLAKLVGAQCYVRDRAATLREEMEGLVEAEPEEVFVPQEEEETEIEDVDSDSSGGSGRPDPEDMDPRFATHGAINGVPLGEDGFTTPDDQPIRRKKCPGVKRQRPLTLVNVRR